MNPGIKRGIDESFGFRAIFYIPIRLNSVLLFAL